MPLKQSPTKGKPNTAGEGRKAEIINVGINLFAEKGYHGTTLDEIAEQVGITKAALYYYISSKEEILQEINKRNMAGMEQAIKLHKSSLPPADKLRKVIQYYVKFAAETGKRASIHFEQTNALPKKHRDTVQRKKKEVERALQEVLREGVEQGCFVIDDVKLASFAILGACNWTYHWYHPDGGLTPEQIAQHFITILEKGYLKSNGSSLNH